MKTYEIPEIDLQSQTTGEVPMVYYCDGKSYKIGGLDMAFVNLLAKCPTALKFMICRIDIQEAEQYIRQSKQERRESVVQLFFKKWVWLMDGERVNLDNLSLNEEFFGFPFNKRRLVSNIRNGTFSEAELQRIEAFFNNDNEIRQVFKD
jgi:hypothetical protein